MDNNKMIYRISYNFNKNLILLLLYFLLPSANMNAMASTNDSTTKVIKDLREKAIRYDRKNDVYNAIEYYNRYLSYKSKDMKLAYRLATLYFDTRDYLKANQYYDSVIRINPRKYVLAYYRKGMACMNLEEYDNAIGYFTKFKKYYNKKNDKFNYRKLAVIYASSAGWAKNNTEINEDITVTHLGNSFNHNDIDFSPFPIDDNTIIYGAIYSDASRQIDPIRQVYKAEKIDGIWKNTGLFEEAINDPEYNTGNAVLTDDGQNIFFTRSRRNWQNDIKSEIFVSHLYDDKWQTPEKLPYPVNIENYSSTQPAVGQNLRTGNYVLYFVSNRPGGKGGLDIWFTEYDKKNNTYKEPVDLSNKVNTVGDECSPFYDNSSRILYFSSRGRKEGLGGYDIYKTTGSDRTWTDAVPLPKPVNSSFDDYYFSIQKNNYEGFFSSNRPGSFNVNNGTCCDDIFLFNINKCPKIYSWGTVRNSVDYDFYDDLNAKYHLGLKYPENNSVLSDVPVELYLSDEKENVDILISRTTTNTKGNFSFKLERNKQYQVLIKNYGYFEKKKPVNTFHSNCADTIAIGTTAINYLPKVSIKVDIYYDFDKYILSDAAKHTIDTMVMPLFDIFPNGIIEIGSHTDSTGTDQYNIDLSQKRSESVVSYINSKGISSERLVAKGYGKSLPIAPNTNKDGSDNPEGRQLNRRTEFKIVGEVSTFNDF
jgi:OmpA-OmpF porin, OOP family